MVKNDVGEVLDMKVDMLGNSECIVGDSESLKKFYTVATRVSYNLAIRYPEVSLLHHYTDIVQDVLVDIVSRNICFDASRGKKYKNFIFSLISNKYSDHFRKLDADKRKSQFTTPIDNIMDSPEDYMVGGRRVNSFSEAEKLSLVDILEGKDFYLDKFENDILIEEFMRLLKDTYTSLGLRQNKKLNIFKIVELKFKGYRNLDIANMFGVRPARISLTLKRNRERLWDVCNTFMGDRIELPYM